MYHSDEYTLDHEYVDINSESGSNEEVTSTASGPRENMQSSPVIVERAVTPPRSHAPSKEDIIRAQHAMFYCHHLVQSPDYAQQARRTQQIKPMYSSTVSRTAYGPSVRGLGGQGSFDSKSDFNATFRERFPKLSNKYSEVSSRYQSAQSKRATTSMSAHRRGSGDGALGSLPPPSTLSDEERDNILRQFSEEDRSARRFMQRATSSHRPGTLSPLRRGASQSALGALRSSDTPMGALLSTKRVSRDGLTPPPMLMTVPRLSGSFHRVGLDSTRLSSSPMFRNGGGLRAKIVSPTVHSLELLNQPQNYLVCDEDVQSVHSARTRRASVSTTGYENAARVLRHTCVTVDDPYDNEISTIARKSMLLPRKSSMSSVHMFRIRHQQQEDAESDTNKAPDSPRTSDTTSEAMTTTPSSNRALTPPLSRDQSQTLESVDAELMQSRQRQRQQHTTEVETVGTVDLAACQRDWNAEFQTYIELPCLTPAAAEKRAQRIRLLQEEFCTAVLPVANRILEERDSTTKTIPPANAGGRAGGDKYIVGNVFFKFCNTAYTEALYGGFEFSIKSATHELQGVNAFVACNAKRLRAPLCMVVTFRGQRLWVSTLLSVDNDSLHYGSTDAGRTIASEDTCFALMRQVARALNIKGHYVGPKGRDLTLMFGPVDIEIHQARDARLYVIDTARLFPPDPNLPWRDHEKFYLHTQLRPELVAENEVPLSSDAFSPFGHNGRSIHDEEVRRAAKKLIDVVIPTVSQKIAYMLFHGVSPENRYTATIKIGRELHRHGVNLRYLGLVLEHFIHVSDRARSSYGSLRQATITHFLAEMVARTVRMQFLHANRHANALRGEDSVRSSLIATCELHNNVFSGTDQSQRFWSRELLPMLFRKFNPGTKGRQLCETLWQRDLLPVDVHPSFYVLTVVRTATLCGLEWNVDPWRDVAFMSRLGRGDTGGSIFTLPLLLKMVPVVKYCKISPFGNVLQLVQSGRLEEAERVYLIELQNREVLLGDVPSIVPLLESLAELYGHRKWAANHVGNLIQTRKRIVKVYQDAMPDPHYVEAYVVSLCTLGELYDSLHEYSEAAKIYPTALHHAREHLLAPNAALGRAHFTNGRLCELQGNFSDAMRQYESCISACGSEEAAFATVDRTRLAIAGLWFHMGNTDKAIMHATEALNNIALRCGEYDAEVGYAKGKLGYVLHRREPATAYQLAKDAVAISRRNFGSKSEQFARSLRVLSVAALYRGDVQEGYTACEESLSIQQYPGTRTIDLADTLVELARYFVHFFHEPCLDAKAEIPMRLMSARAYLKQAVDIYDAVLINPKKHPKVCRVMTLQADWHRIVRQFTEAHSLASSALERYETHSLYHTGVADAMLTLGRASCVTGRHAEAVQLYYRALSIYEEHEEHPAVVLELLTVCLPHTRVRHRAPLLSPQFKIQKLMSDLHFSHFLLHHRQYAQASFVLRSCLSLYRDLFPIATEWSEDASELLKHMKKLLEDTTSSMRVAGGDDVVTDLQKLVDREESKRKGFTSRENARNREEEQEQVAREEARKSKKVDSILRQLQVYLSMGKARNALHMFAPALIAYRAVWPPVVEDILDEEERARALAVREALQSALKEAEGHLTSPDHALYVDTHTQLCRTLNLDLPLPEGLKDAPMEAYEFLRGMTDIIHAAGSSSTRHES